MEPIELTAAELADLIAASPLFAALNDDLRAALGDEVEARHADAGETVMDQGDPADGLYVVYAGRLQVRVTDNDGATRVVGEAGRGDVVGELALITDRPRNATVVAVRDSQLLYLSADAFVRLIADEPAALRHLTTRIVDDLVAANMGRPVVNPVRVVAVLPVGSTTSAPSVADALLARSESDGRDSIQVVPEHVDADLGPSPTPARLSGLLDRLERDHDRVILVGEPGRGLWNERCARQADLVILVADATAEPEASRLETVLRRLHDQLSIRVELVLVYPAEADRAHGGARWLATRRVDRHHNVRATRPDDHARVARLVLGGAVVVAFSGGGARGMAELGVVRALREAGVPIDAVAGTSAGALVAGTVARGYEPEQATRILRDGLVEQKSPVDLTVPVVSLAAGRRMTERLQAVADDLDLEDAWLPCFFISTNLTRVNTTMHRTGPAWLALRSSVSIPGVFPPVAHEGDVLVDGGLVDNLPTARLRSEHPGSIVVAVDVSARKELEVGDLPEGGVISGWDMLASRLDPRRDRLEVAGLIRILTRLSELGHRDQDDSLADVTIRPDVDDIAMLDFKRFDEIVERGYRAGLAAVADNDTLQALAR